MGPQLEVQYARRTARSPTRTLPSGWLRLQRRSGGWLQRPQVLADGAREGSIDRELLHTDGLANVGVTDPAKLIGLCRNAAARGVMTTTIGFGRDYDEELLTAMADAGGGGAHYIEEPDEAPVIFEEELAGLLSIAAQNERVSIHVGDAADFANLITYIT